MDTQGTVETQDLNIPQLKFTVDVMAMVLDKLIQDDMDRDKGGYPLPVEEQSSTVIQQAMQILQYE